MTSLTLETKIEELLDSSGNNVVLQEGEAFNLTGTVTDIDGATLTSAALTTIELTLYDEETGDALNSRLDVDISASVATTGAITLRFEAADNVINSTTLAEKALESHIIRLVWKWNDGTSIRIGICEHRFRIQKAVVVA